MGGIGDPPTLSVPAERRVRHHPRSSETCGGATVMSLSLFRSAHSPRRGGAERRRASALRCAWACRQARFPEFRRTSRQTVVRSRPLPMGHISPPDSLTRTRYRCAHGRPCPDSACAFLDRGHQEAVADSRAAGCPAGPGPAGGSATRPAFLTLTAGHRSRAAFPPFAVLSARAGSPFPRLAVAAAAGPSPAAVRRFPGLRAFRPVRARPGIPALSVSTGRRFGRSSTG